MTFKKCRNEGCEVQIEVRNTAEGWRPFEENGNKHNCQYSDYAKKQRGKMKEEWEEMRDFKPKEDKDDHGNEMVQGFPIPTVKEYVDHTLKPDFNLKTLTDPTPEGIDLKYNNFAKEHKIRYSQSHVLGSQYTVYVWYEDSGK